MKHKNILKSGEFVFLPVACDGTITGTMLFKIVEEENGEHQFSNSIWNSRYGSMMGGNVKFRGAGQYKLHFEVSNAPGNIAEGKSAPDRPAVLGEATHDYFNCLRWRICEGETLIISL